MYKCVTVLPNFVCYILFHYHRFYRLKYIECFRVLYFLHKIVYFFLPVQTYDGCQQEMAFYKTIRSCFQPNQATFNLWFHSFFVCKLTLKHVNEKVYNSFSLTAYFYKYLVNHTHVGTMHRYRQQVH